MAKKSVEIFTKKTFEEALPKLKGTDKPAWFCAGLVEGEYVYLLPLGDNKPAQKIGRAHV